MAFLALGAVGAVSWAVGRLQRHDEQRVESPTKVNEESLGVHRFDASKETCPSHDMIDAHGGFKSELLQHGPGQPGSCHGQTCHCRWSPTLGHTNAAKAGGRIPAEGLNSPAPGGHIAAEQYKLLAEAILAQVTNSQSARAQKEPAIVNLLMLNSSTATQVDAASAVAQAPAAVEPPRDDMKRRKSVQHWFVEMASKALCTVLLYEAAKQHIVARSRQPEAPLMAAVSSARRAIHVMTGEVHRGKRKW
jgi:hypothetical protein